VTKSLRFLPALGAVLFALVGLSACGGGIPGNAVVSVNGSPITKATFHHWMQVASASTATAGGKPVVPDPPAYTACIAHLAATAPKPAKGQKAPTSAQLKSECEQQYKSLQQQVLGFLISSDWVIGEASHLGVKLTDAEVKKQFVKIKTQQFPKASEFEAFLAKSGQTVSDLLLRIKAVSLLPQRIEAKIVKNKGKVTEAQITSYYNTNKSRFRSPSKHGKPGAEMTLSQVKASIKQQLTATQQQTALTTFVKAFKKKWTAKTECRAGYIVPDCKQYKAPKTSSKLGAPSTGETEAG
jgi:foldase protein PrsA